MTDSRRSDPDPEWVKMYRQGITTLKIAAGAWVAGTTVRCYLAIAARLEPSLRDEHHEAALVSPRITAAARQNLEDVLTLYRLEGRLPTTKGASVRERALGVWLHRRRQEATEYLRLGSELLVSDPSEWHRQRLAWFRAHLDRLRESRSPLEFLLETREASRREGRL